MTHRAARPLLLLLAAIALLAAPSCRESARLGDPWSPRQPLRAYVELELRHELDAALRERSEARAGRDALRDLIAQETPKTWRERVNTSVKYADLFERLYTAREFVKLAARHDGLTARGEAILRALERAPRHDIEEPMSYHVERIRALDEELAAQAEGGDPWRPIVLTPEEVEDLVIWLRERDLSPGDPATRDVVVRALMGEPPAGADGEEAPEPSPIPRVGEQLTAFEEAISTSVSKTAELELYTLDGALRYARDMKHFNLSRQTWRDLKKAGGSKALIYSRLASFFSELAAAEPDEVEGVFDALEPATHHYRGLVEARARYKEIVAQGGWPEVRPFALREGVRTPQAKRLRERLRLEGYLPDEEDASEGSEQEQGADRVDAALLEAVAAYHATHQLAYEPGRPSRSFWRSLNLPARERLAQIELNMERWRSSRYDGEQDFVFVNLPDFHAEVWADGERKLRFRVVIGKNNRECDPKTQKWVYPNATPRLMSELEHFILNPSWYVPQRIIEEEIKPKVEADEGWLEANGYEIMKREVSERDGEDYERWTVRQKPGPNNALGVAKFIFPNPHNTYMHDTAKKKYFDYNLRAYSHGCMRVQTPVELAKYLVEADGQADEYDVDELLATGRTKMIKLNEALPVFVEYYTVQIDDEGRPNFLADIYDLDERAEDPDAFDRCTAPRPPKPKPEGDDEAPPPDIQDDMGP